MTQSTHLKLSSFAFSVFWTVGMIAVSGTYQIAEIIITSIAGAMAGVGWYYAMRWFYAHWQMPRTPDGI